MFNFKKDKNMLIILINLGILSVIVSIIENDDKVIQLFVCFVGIVSICLGVSGLTEEVAYKEALVGNNIYKMEIKYEIKDSVYVPSDTNFVLIKK